LQKSAPQRLQRPTSLPSGTAPTQDYPQELPISLIG
jgi:hypothetical protein